MTLPWVIDPLWEKTPLLITMSSTDHILHFQNSTFPLSLSLSHSLSHSRLHHLCLSLVLSHSCCPPGPPSLVVSYQTCLHLCLLSNIHTHTHKSASPLGLTLSSLPLQFSGQIFSSLGISLPVLFPSCRSSRALQNTHCATGKGSPFCQFYQ